MINTAAGLAIILVLSEIAGLHYILANMIGYACGLGIGFILHRRITFRNQAQDHHKRRELTRFILIFMLAYLSQLGVLYILVAWMGLYTAIAQILAIGVYTVLNYLGNRYFTFHTKT